MLREFLCVMAGGAAGAALRYGAGLMLQGVRAWSMPVATLVVNIAGCLLLGMLTGVGERYAALPRGMMLMFTVGVCGAFTTFSTFTSETIKAIEQGQVMSALAYVVISVAGGLLVFWLGHELM